MFMVPTFCFDDVVCRDFVVCSTVLGRQLARVDNFYGGGQMKKLASNGRHIKPSLLKYSSVRVQTQRVLFTLLSNLCLFLC